MYRFTLKTVPTKVVVGKHPQTGEEITVPLTIGMEDVPEDRIREEPFKYRTQLLDILTRAPVDEQQRGMDILRVRKVWKLLTKIKKAKDGDTVAFENEDWKLIKETWEKARWNVATEEIMQFDGDLNAAKEEDVDKIAASTPLPLAESSPNGADRVPHDVAPGTATASAT